MAKGGYLLALMGGFWVTGVIPIYATALIPMLLGPLMGLEKSGALAKDYMPVSFLNLDS